MGWVRDTSAGTYKAVYRDPDGRLRGKTFRKRKDADLFLAHMKVDISKGMWTDPRGARKTFADWADEWLALDPDKRATSLARDRAALKNHLLPALGSRPLGSIRRSDVQRLVNEMRSKLAPATVLRNYSTLRAILQAAFVDELIGRNPCLKIKLPEAERNEKRFLTPEELKRLGAAMPAEFRPMVYVAGALGLRWSEVVGLRVRSIDFLRRRLTIDETLAEVGGQLIPSSVKTPASRRTLSVPPFLVSMLAEHLARTGRRDPDAYVFQTETGCPMRASNFRRRVWGPAVAEARLEGLTFHGLRHTSAALMRHANVHTQVIQNRLGHASSQTTTQIYGSVLDEDDVAAAESLDQLFFEDPGDDSYGG